MGIKDKRVSYKPFEYPEVMEFVDRINQTFWVHSELDFTGDVQDFHTALEPHEKEVIIRSMLGISQVEVGVKSFWGSLYSHFPKPEFNGLGATFAESEFRHSESYSRIISVLGLEHKFGTLLDIPIFKEKVDMINKHLHPDLDIVGKLLYFTIITENTALFSLFANVLSLTRFKGKMKNVSNIIAWTSADEDCHAAGGIYLLNKLREEGYLTDRMVEAIRVSSKEYIKFEGKILDWIYEHGELNMFSKEDMLNFMKYRVDTAFNKLNIKPVFNITPEQYAPMKWFDEEIYANSLDDFFAKKPVDYTKHDKPVTGNDLF